MMDSASVMRPVVLIALSVAAALVPAEAGAQLCRGLPAKAAFAVGSRDKDGGLTGELGIGPFGMVSLSGNVAFPNDPPNGSSSISYGGRVYWGATRDKWGACMLTGLQIGYAHLINAEGLRANARITSSSIPIGFGYGRSLKVARGIRLVAFAIPQVGFRSRNYVLYTRADTATVSNTSTDPGAEVGGGLQLGPLLLRASAFRSQDVPWTWRLTAGLGR